MRKLIFFFALIFVTSLAVVPSYIRAYVVSGDSDAPRYVSGDKVLVNLVAYYVRVPYSNKVIFKSGDPQPGDYILFRSSDGNSIFKRIVGIPGNTIKMEQESPKY